MATAAPTPPRPSVDVRVEDAPAAADIALLDEHVAAFTLRRTGHGAPVPIGVFARCDGAVVGGLHGWSWGGCCELVSLWVGERWRGQGLGRALLAEAEAAARARGCAQVVLFSHDVQAPSFYLHAGYEMVGELEDYPVGGTAYWFRKRLDRRPPRPAVRRLLRTTVWALVGGTAVLARPT
jgi:ribosomal protein S18 acetylase RimI-like enzyme